MEDIVDNVRRFTLSDCLHMVEFIYFICFWLYFVTDYYLYMPIRCTGNG